MKIHNLKLQNFRNYNNLNINFDDKLNIIYGNNGGGKTNLIEAIYLLSLTKSFRTNNDKNLILKNEENSIISGDILKNNNISNYKINLNKIGKKIEIDNNKIDKISDYISRISIIIFYPSEIELIHRAPNERRRFINIEISQLYKEYVIILNNYNKLLKQRNAYLKQLFINGNKRTEYLDILTNKLIEYGLLIHNYREKFINEINELVNDIYKKIFIYGELKIKYISSYNNKSKEDLVKMYQNIYQKELMMGKTLIGVNYDDIEFILDKNKLRDWGSQGQIKNSILAFKIAEINLVYKIKKEYPILILDDLFSEIDKEKIKNIMNLFDEEIQTFITTTDINNIDQEIKNKSKIFFVENGIIKEEENE
ncbi:MAG: DNA replication/repair protein RecF [Firmicutes bacterium]|nr:DNA replication/repair protein RecF [Bacillota bacterium]